jgi:hypothetical protein
MRRIAWLGVLMVATSCGGGGGSAATSGGAGGASPNGSGSDRSSGGEPGLGGMENALGGTISSSGGSSEASGGAANGGTLSAKYPGDQGIATDPAVLFHDDFNGGFGAWAYPNADTEHLTIQNDPGDEGQSAFLRSRVSEADLEVEEYISSSTRGELKRRVPEMYVRYRTRFVGHAPNPHHWVRFSAGTEAFSSSGLANTVPPGDSGFWFDFDVSQEDHFNFYVYWYKMRSGRCNDGSTTPGCAGDQGTTYHYGNDFSPSGQSPFTREEWFCIEIRARANSVGTSDGLLAFWINDAPVGEFGPGTPTGTWLRDTFFTEGCTFSACGEPEPFEGFDFRSNDDVLFKEFFLDAYYERGSFADKKAALEEAGITVDLEAVIDYDDVVVATERIGCPR